MESDPNNLIIIKKSKVKYALGVFFDLIIKIHLKITSITTAIYIKIFSSSKTMQDLVSNEAITLLLNTLLFAFIGNLFRGLIGEIAAIVCFFNILAFLINKMEWVEKLKK